MTAAPEVIIGSPRPDPARPDPAGHDSATGESPLHDARGRHLRHDGWTPERRRDFLAHLADGNTVADAAAMVGLSATSAYALRRRADGATFALGWRAATLVARDVLGDTLLRRALYGTTETTIRGDVVTERTRVDNRLALSLLNRLDRQADAATAGEADSARRVANEFDAYLSLVAADASPARAGGFLAARAATPAGAEPVVALARADAFRRAGAGTPAEVATADLDPDARAGWTADQWCRAEAAGLVALAPRGRPLSCEASQLVHDGEGDPDPVWYDEEHEDWRTAFPPPAGFWGVEIGEPGEDGYERALSPEEAMLFALPEEARVAAVVARGEDERDAFFAALRADLVAEGLLPGPVDARPPAAAPAPEVPGAAPDPAPVPPCAAEGPPLPAPDPRHDDTPGRGATRDHDPAPVHAAPPHAPGMRVLPADGLPLPPDPCHGGIAPPLETSEETAGLPPGDPSWRPLPSPGYPRRHCADPAHEPVFPAPPYGSVPAAAPGTLPSSAR